MTISKAPAPANWKKWQFMLSCILWDACCLTFNFEPDHGGLNRNVLHDWLARKRLPNNFPADFADRLLLLTSNFKTNVGGEVSLSNIAEFCLRCEWQIPDEMKALIKMSAPVTQVQDNETRAPMPIAAEQKEVTAKATPTGPRLQVNKAALIAQHKHEWPTIEGDIRGASENGLSKVAKAGARDWYEDAAIQWARSKNKLIQPTSAATLNSAMSNLPSRKHRLKD
jgi:hypothetical protein